MTYHCPQCDGTNVAQEESHLWHLNKEQHVKDSTYMEDYYWCLDCDEQIAAVAEKEDDE